MTSNTERLNAALGGNYRIVRHLGEGGMASVYLCDDLRHGRQVALKLLKPELAARIGAERFIQEIRTTASLQHPHILPLFDSGSVDGFLYYVMPFIPGETLRARLERERQLPIDEAVRIARDVAEALDYAHRQGIIHRDIKPENILLQDGRPLVADFGIALALSAATDGRMTETGLSLGTPHYMSPEQATADKDIGPRSDVYAVGSVLYEMLAGTPPHHGGSSQQVIMKILTEEPTPVTALRKAVPSHVADVTRTALEKVPADRFVSAKAFAEALGNTGYRRQHSSDAPAVRQARTWRAPLLVAAVACCSIAATWLWQRFAGRTEAGNATVYLTLPVAPLDPLSNIAGRGLAISSDGNRIAFATSDSTGQNAVYVRAIDEEKPRKIKGTEGGLYPGFSFDGAWIYFVVGRSLRRVSVGDGMVEPVTVINDFQGMTGARDGMFVSSGGRLVQIRYDGTAVDTLIKTQSFRGYRPQAIDDGTLILLALASATADSTLAVLKLGESSPSFLPVTGTAAIGFVDGSLLFVKSDASLHVVKFDPSSLKTSGSSRLVESNLVTTRASQATKVVASRTGSLVFMRGAPSYEVVDVDRQGLYTRLPLPVAPYQTLRLSPDNSQLAVDLILASSDKEVWIHDRTSGAGRPLTRGQGFNDRPEWTPDGTRIMFRTLRGDRTTLWWQRSDGSDSAAALVAPQGRSVWQGLMLRDGRTVLYRTGVQGDADMWYRSLGDSVEHAFAQSPASETGMRPSPDGKWVAFQSDESGTPEVYVQAFPGPGGRVPISIGGGTIPLWAPSGKELFYVTGQRFMSATLSFADGVKVVERRELFRGPFFYGFGHAAFDVTKDGQRFVMLRPIGGEGETINWIHNWARKLAKGKGDLNP